jgi:hypothetical protein
VAIAALAKQVDESTKQVKAQIIQQSENFAAQVEPMADKFVEIMQEIP